MPSISSPRFNRNLHLAIDQGGQSTRVAIYTSSGQQVCVYTEPCTTRTYQCDDSAYPFIEQDGAAILAGIRTCLQKIQQQLGADVQHIVSAGFAGQGSSLLCWNNQTGEALTPVLSWQDIRGEPYLSEIALDNTQLQQLTGLRLSPHYGASKMRWCLEHNEKVAQAQQENCLSIGPIISYIFWHLLDTRVRGYDDKNNDKHSDKHNDKHSHTDNALSNGESSSLRTQGTSSTHSVDTRVRGYDDKNNDKHSDKHNGKHSHTDNALSNRESSSLRMQGTSSTHSVDTRVRGHDDKNNDKHSDKHSHTDNALSNGESSSLRTQGTSFISSVDTRVRGYDGVLIDPGHAQRTLLWNLQHNDWDQSLLAIFKIPRAVLPHCKYHNSHFGNFHFGDHTIPFTASARDQGASLFARGLPEPDACYINIGTGAFIQRLSENLHAPEGLLVSPLWLPDNGFQKNPADKKYYAWEATVNGAAAAISFIQQHTGLAITPPEIDRALELNPTGDCYFLNAVGGLSAPYWRTDLQSHFSDNLSAEEKILAWIESVIFQIVVNVQLMNQAGDTKKIIISGGFSKANAVCQKIADLTKANIHRSDNADATLQGIACMAAGLPKNWQPVLQEDVFRPQANQHMQQRFAQWQVAMDNWLK